MKENVRDNRHGSIRPSAVTGMPAPVTIFLALAAFAIIVTVMMPVAFGLSRWRPHYANGWDVFDTAGLGHGVVFAAVEESGSTLDAVQVKKTDPAGLPLNDIDSLMDALAMLRRQRGFIPQLRFPASERLGADGGNDARTMIAGLGAYPGETLFRLAAAALEPDQITDRECALLVDLVRATAVQNGISPSAMSVEAVRPTGTDGGTTTRLMAILSGPVTPEMLREAVTRTVRGKNVTVENEILSEQKTLIKVYFKNSLCAELLCITSVAFGESSLAAETLASTPKREQTWTESSQQPGEIAANVETKTPPVAGPETMLAGQATSLEGESAATAVADATPEPQPLPVPHVPEQKPPQLEQEPAPVAPPVQHAAMIQPAPEAAVSRDATSEDLEAGAVTSEPAADGETTDRPANPGAPELLPDLAPVQETLPSTEPEIVLARNVVPVENFPPAEEPEAPAAEGESTKVRLGIILDDGGYGGSEMTRVMELDSRLTLSILPDTPYASETVQLALENGFEIMVHMPMQAGHGTKNRFPGELNIGMTREQVLARTRECLDQFPEAVGVNNHTGGLFTTYAEKVGWFLEVVREEQMYFVDSRTVGSSRAYSKAVEAGIPAARRDLFLDHSNALADIRKRFNELVEMAKKHGCAVGIGHFRANTVTVLAEKLPGLEALGIELVPLSELVW